MKYSIEYLPSFEKDLKKLSGKIVKEIFARLDGFPENPRPRGYKKIKGSKDLYRLRVGDYRIVYRIDDRRKSACLILARHRSKVYQSLKNL